MNLFLSVKNLLFLFRVWTKKLFFAFPSSLSQRYMHKGVPYFSQWESPDLVMSGSITAYDDPRWKASGAETRKEYELWSWNDCGMACLKMILAAKLKKNIPIVKLGKQCQKYGGYIYREGRLDGLYYKPFLFFIKQEFSLNGQVVSPMLIEDIINALDRGKFAMVSVSYKIRNPQDQTSLKGGHLVLMLGYDLMRQELFFHNPSGDKKSSRQYVKITFSDFEKFFAHRGCTIF